MRIDPLWLDKTHFVADASGIDIPKESSIRRTPPRPPELRQFAYMSQFDSRGLFQDVFWIDGQVVLVGPPLENLVELVLGARFTFDGRPPAGPPQLFKLDRTHRMTFAVPQRPRQMRFESDAFTVTVPVRRNEADVFKGRRVLFTQSRNNDLHWIEDWIEYHVRAHGADAVLLYDNASDRYTSGELLRRISAVPGMKAAVVVRWPYVFGPLADISKMWDSDYCQFGVLEDARRRFLPLAEGVLQVDVDELVVCADRSSIFDRLHHSISGVIGFEGRWLEAVAVAPSEPRRHRDFAHYHAVRMRAAPKWAAIPARVPDDVQWRVHLVGVDFVMDGGEVPPFQRHHNGLAGRGAGPVVPSGPRRPRARRGLGGADASYRLDQVAITPIDRSHRQKRFDPPSPPQ